MKQKKNSKQLKKVANSLWSSKLRYGLQLYSKVRIQETEPKNVLMESLQVAQNKLLRVLEGVFIKDKVSIDSMLKKHEMMSVNQTAAQIKLTEIWEATHIDTYPLKVMKQCTAENGRVTRGDLNNKLVEGKKTTLNLNSCATDATSLWNHAPVEIRNAKTLYQAKKHIKAFVHTLPQ